MPPPPFQESGPGSDGASAATAPATCPPSAARSKRACAMGRSRPSLPPTPSNWALTSAGWARRCWSGIRAPSPASWQQAGRAGRGDDPAAGSPGCLRQPARPVPGPPSRLLLRPLARTGPDQPRPPADPAQPPALRHVRAAFPKRRELRFPAGWDGAGVSGFPGHEPGGASLAGQIFLDGGFLSGCRPFPALGLARECRSAGRRRRRSPGPWAKWTWRIRTLDGAPARRLPARRPAIFCPGIEPRNPSRHAHPGGAGLLHRTAQADQTSRLDRS